MPLWARRERKVHFGGADREAVGSASRHAVRGWPSIREWPLETFGRAVGYVPQDTFLFSETLRENSPSALTAATDQEILNAADVASIAAEIREFPAQFDTMVGERGITLSGGQKQRAAIARAVIRDPKILILDDSLSSVDTGPRSAS